MSALLDALDGVTVHDLAQPLHDRIPSSPNHPGFRMALTRRHGDTRRPDGSSAASELIITGGHVGTHVDALAHVSHRGRLHGDVDAAHAQAGGRFSTHGIDTLEPIVGRGVLLDVAAALGEPELDGGTGIGPADLRRAERHAGVRVRASDVVLVRTGWSRRFGDPEAFLGHRSGVPGVSAAGARWLAARDVRATGADTTAYERIPPGAGHRLLPVHRILLVEHGIPIIEMLELDGLSRARAYEFAFVLAPLKIVGATGSPVRPLALVG